MNAQTQTASKPFFDLQYLSRQAFYRGVRLIARIVSAVVYCLRTEGQQNLDFKGGGMLLSTHQSMMDPVLVGLVANRRLNYLARKTLFKNRLFGFMIGLLDAIEIDRERGGLAGLREMLKRLQRGELVLMFPEGTRTSDGEIAPLKPGFIPVARRSQVPLLPIAVVGAYDCLPKGTRLPTRRPIAVVFGEPIPCSVYMPMSDAEIIKILSDRLHALHARGKELVRGD